MTQIIPLIDKQDVNEQLLEQIGSILALETGLQQALATAGGEDPNDYAFKVYLERVNPWEIFITDSDVPADLWPIVNVWYDRGVYDESASNVSTRQKANSIFNIDCYTHVASAETPGGHTPGDEASALKVHHVAKLIRNIIMHDKYKQMGIPGIWKRWIKNQDVFRPSSGQQAIQNVIACRLALEIGHNETILQADEETIELINVKMYREPDGQIIAELDIGAAAP